MNKLLHETWSEVLKPEFQKEYFQSLESFVDQARRTETVFPKENDVFRALQLTGLPDTRVVILGQDPYHDDDQAHGLCFSVPEGIPHPPSLRNIFTELESDTGIARPQSGDLSNWASQGVLLLNTVLTVAAHQAHSHQKQGWEIFTDQIVSQLGKREQHTVFILWGKQAQKKEQLVDTDSHTVIKSAHPSPLSAYRGFFGSRPFSQANSALRARGQREIDWSL